MNDVIFAVGESDQSERATRVAVANADHGFGTVHSIPAD